MTEATEATDATTVTGSDFPVAFADRSEAERTWGWDDMHMPRALTPLAADYVRALASGFAYRYRRLEVPFEIEVRIWNGYAYFAADYTVPESERSASLGTMPAARRAQIDRADAYWHETALPRVREIYAWIAARPAETATPAELVAAWDGVWTRIERCWQTHFYAICGPYQVLDDLADMYESIIPDAPPAEALGLIGGALHVLHDVESQLERLAAMVTATPELAERLAAPDPTLAELRKLPPARPFVEALDGFLAEHGHLGQAFDDLALPSWIEEPSILLTELAKRSERAPRNTGEERHVRLTAEAEMLATRVRERLGDDAERRAEFDKLLETAQRIGPLTELHNYWIDRMAQSTLRRFVMRVAQRLVAAGVIAEPGDVLFLGRGEIRELLETPEDRRDLVAQRRDEWLHWSSIRPPRHVGKPGEPPDDRFDGSRYETADASVIQGTGASVGTVRGTARVTRSPDDFGAVQAGDIIICPSSNPSWVPLFSIAAGMVTDTGGVLSHAAVVAREFGLPAVVGTGDATVRIADGRLIEIDGRTGTVRLL